jgi:hypothetical protein
MATLDEIDARLALRAAHEREAEMPSTFTGPLPQEESMPGLTDEIKEFIVKRLACFETPSKVADAVKVNFGVAVTRQRVYVYDPRCSQPPARRWRDLHAMTREKYLRDVAEIGVSHKVVRLQMLDRLVNRCERNSIALTLASLTLAAKECGGFYENRRPILLQLPAAQPAEPQSSVPPPSEHFTHHAAGRSAAETCNTISAAATIISIGSEGAALSPLSGPLPARNNSATCSDA